MLDPVLWLWIIIIFFLPWLSEVYSRNLGLSCEATSETDFPSIIYIRRLALIISHLVTNKWQQCRTQHLINLRRVPSIWRPDILLQCSEMSSLNKPLPSWWMIDIFWPVAGVLQSILLLWVDDRQGSPFVQVFQRLRDSVLSDMHVQDHICSDVPMLVWHLELLSHYKPVCLLNMSPTG